MKEIIFILTCIFILTSCSSTIEEQDEENHFEGTTSVEKYGDSIRIEFEDRGRLTINHFMHLDSLGEVTFINNTVSLNNRIDQTKADLQDEYGTLDIGEYEIRFPKDQNITDTNSIVDEFIRIGHFQCYSNSTFIPDAFILEKIIEGNGTYRNQLFLIDPGKGDTIQFFNFYDGLLIKSYSWEYYDVEPMTWKEYKEKRKELRQLTNGIANGAEK